MADKTIVVLGATGKTGRRVVSRLRRTSHPVRAVSRSSEVRFEWADRSTWEVVLAGASAVYLVPPRDHGQVAAFVDRATAAGVTRLVLVSDRAVYKLGAQDLLFGEREVRESGVEWTILRPGWFAQNFDEGVFRDVVMAGALALPVGDGLEPFVDVDDIADVAVAALTGDGHAGQTYELTGPSALSFGDAVGLIAGATGRTITFTDVPVDTFVERAVARGMSSEAAAHAAALFTVVRHDTDQSSRPADGVRRALGRDAGDFGSYVRKAVAAGAWASPTGSATP